MSQRAPKNKKALALLSSGLDSTVALAMARKEGFVIEAALTFDYGQIPAQQEIEHAKKLCDSWKIPHQVIPLSFLEIPKTQIPTPSQTDLENFEVSQKNAEAVWVPNRNGVFLEVAAAFAEKQGADWLVVGFNQEEATTFPDNSQNYIRAINQALFFSTANHVEVMSPTKTMNKNEILAKAIELEIPLSWFWSCYRGEKQMCGTCESCMRLKRAFVMNRIKTDDYFKDPTF